MPLYSWLIFDADGTLFDFHRAEAIALEITPRQLGVRAPRNFDIAYHAINDSLWREFEAGRLQAQNVRTERFKRLFDELHIAGDSNAFGEAFLANLVRETRFYEGAELLLATLTNRVGLVLLTNGFADVQRARIARLGLQETFDHVVISQEVGAAKPERAIFDIALKRMGSPDKANVLIIGDSLVSDIRGGADYGIDTCWFNPERRANTTDVRPTHEIQRLEELANLVFRQGTS